jgi:hypothetical protein
MMVGLVENFTRLFVILFYFVVVFVFSFSRKGINKNILLVFFSLAGFFSKKIFLQQTTKEWL